MTIDTNELNRLSQMPEAELLRFIGDKALGAGLGAADVSDEEKEEEGRAIAENLKPVKPGICGSPAVRAFISGTNNELTADLVAIVGDVSLHSVHPSIVPIPVLALTVAFIRFGLRKYCAHEG